MCDRKLRAVKNQIARAMHSVGVLINQKMKKER